MGNFSEVYKFITLILQDNKVLRLISICPYYRTVTKQVVWDRITHLRMNLRIMRFARFRFECAVDDFFLFETF